MGLKGIKRIFKWVLVLAILNVVVNGFGMLFSHLPFILLMAVVCIGLTAIAKFVTNNLFRK